MVRRNSRKCGVMDRTEKNHWWAIHRRLEGRKVQNITAALRTSQKTVDRWWTIYRKHGWAICRSSTGNSKTRVSLEGDMVFESLGVGSTHHETGKPK
jgi:transposase